MFSVEYGYSLQLEASKEYGRREGWETGKEEGRNEEKFIIARSLFNMVISFDKISKATGLVKKK